MLRLFLIIMLIAGMLSGFTQDVKVMYVSGNVIRLDSNKPLLRGARFSMPIKLKFSSPKDSVTILMVNKGIGYITPGKLPSSTEALTELMASLEKIFWLSNKRKALTGRNGVLSGFAEISAFFKQYSTVGAGFVVIDRRNVEISTAFTNGLPKGQFYIQYQRNGEDINKFCRYEPAGNLGKLFIDSSLFYIDGKKMYGELHAAVTLWYYAEVKQESTPVAEFYLHVTTLDKNRDVFCSFRTEENWQVLADIFLQQQLPVIDKEYLEQVLARLSCH